MKKSGSRIIEELKEFRKRKNIVSTIIKNNISEEEDFIGREWWFDHECYNEISNWERDVDLDCYYPHVKIIPNSIGSTIFLQCPFCKEKKDVTDYKTW